jgi:hypothetical protein
MFVTKTSSKLRKYLSTSYKKQIPPISTKDVLSFATAQQTRVLETELCTDHEDRYRQETNAYNLPFWGKRRC